MRICFLAPSGYGKSTAIELLSRRYNLINIKIAEPLYELQTHFYQTLSIDIGSKQDGELLQFYGAKIRKEQPMYLLNTFYDKVLANSDFDMITNDDCRPDDYEFLKSMGFIFIKITGFKRLRSDHTPVNGSHPVEWQTDIPFDYNLLNISDINAYKANILELMEVLINHEQVLHRTRSKKM